MVFNVKPESDIRKLPTETSITNVPQLKAKLKNNVVSLRKQKRVTMMEKKRAGFVEKKKIVV